jgi:hypothetical protein
MSCFQSKTYLTKEEKQWNPYKKGQMIVFESNTKLLDSILIEDIKYAFPDGLGVVDKNEILDVVGRKKRYHNNREVRNYILEIHAKTSKRGTRVRFGVSIKDSEFYSGYYKLEQLNNLPMRELLGGNVTYYDVIKIRTRNRLDETKEILFIYWSKSKGFVRFDETDGTIWELKEVK